MGPGALAMTDHDGFSHDGLDGFSHDGLDGLSQD